MAENKEHKAPADTKPVVTTEPKPVAVAPVAAKEPVVHKTEAEKKADAEYKAMRDAQEKMNNEVMAAQAKCRPTPTIDEVMLALEGKHVDHKQHDGSKEQNVHHVPVSASKQIEVGNKDVARETKKDE